MNADEFVEVVKSGALENIADAMTNIFETAVLPVREKAVQLKEIIRDGGAFRSMMSGSGPSVFGIFNKKDLAEMTVRRLADLGITAHLCEPYYPGENQI